MLAALAAVVVASPTIAAAAAKHAATAGSANWATIDICDSVTHPDTIGIRGAMAGDGHARDKMFMRFRVEYRKSANVWRLVAGADSGWLPLGSADVIARQAERWTASP